MLESITTSITDFFRLAGIAGPPLVLFGVLGMTVAFREILLRLKRRRFIDSEQRQQVIRCLLRQREEEALAVCDRHCDDPALAITAEGLRSGFDSEKTRYAISAAPFQNGIGFLKTVIVLMPLLGLLGTILSMIPMASFFKSFTLQKTPVLMGAIFQAMDTTGYALLVASTLIALLHFVIINLRQQELSSVGHFLAEVRDLSSGAGVSPAFSARSVGFQPANPAGRSVPASSRDSSTPNHQEDHSDPSRKSVAEPAPNGSNGNHKKFQKV